MANDLDLGSNLGDPLDHDGDGRKGGSLKGEKSTRARAAKKNVAVQATDDPDASWIILDDHDDIPPSGLPLSHNGEAIMIMTGVPVKVPNKYLNILDDAVQSRPVIDPLTRQTVGWRDAPRYPYRKTSAPAQD